jgi:hypothetical protein
MPLNGAFRAAGMLLILFREDFIMKTAVKILKIVGRTAASVIIWAAGILERRE